MPLTSPTFSRVGRRGGYEGLRCPTLVSMWAMMSSLIVVPRWRQSMRYAAASFFGMSIWTRRMPSRFGFFPAFAGFIGIKHATDTGGSSTGQTGKSLLSLTYLVSLESRP